MAPPSVEVECLDSASTFICSNNANSDKDNRKLEVAHSETTSTPPSILPISPSLYAQLFPLGDIPADYHAGLSKSLRSFNAKWKLMLKRSDSIDPIMKALGVGMLKRGVMNKFSAVSEFTVSADCSSLQITTHLPLGVAKTTTVSFDKHQIQEHHDETGKWKSQGFFHDGRVIQRRDKTGGVMYDTRGVFDIDPLDPNNNCSVMLFVWTYVTDKGETFSANRWLEKIE